MDNLSLLLAASAGANGGQFQNSQSTQQSGLGFLGGNSDSALLSLLGGGSQQQSASDSGGNSGLIAALLQHSQQEQLRKAREEQEKTLLLRKLQELANPQPELSRDDLALLILRQKQQMAQNSGFSMQPGQNPLLSSNFSANLAATSQASPANMDANTLARLLQAQSSPQPQPSLVPAGLSSAAAGLAAPQGLDFGATAGITQGRRKGRTGTFPQKLHQMLSDLERQEGGAEIASFLPHGRAFAIHKPRDFVKHVMPKYFRMSRFSSFQRQLNLYDFQRITEGPDKGSYYHELFVQGRPILSTMMKRNKIKGIKNKKNESNAEPEKEDDASVDGDEEDM